MTADQAPGPDRDRQRRSSARHRCRAARHRAGLAARPGPDRRQGGLRRGRVRRLLGAGRPARDARTTLCRTAGATRWTALNACLRAGARARRPGGRHLRRPRHAGCPAPGAAGDGRPRWLAVRLLHAGLHLQHGRRVLPAGPRRRQRAIRRTNGHATAARRARPQRVRPARAQREPLPLHRVPADPRRRVRARRTRRRTTRSRPAAARPHRRSCPPAWRSGDAEFVRPADLGDGAGAAGRPARRHGDRPAARTGASRSTCAAPARRSWSPSTGCPSCARSPSATRASRSARRSPCPRPSGCSTAGCRCWTSCSRSSRPG